MRSPDNKNSETLSLGGAIYKRKWRHSGQLEHLHEALFFYLEAYKRNPQQDMGYAGVNAAFILDLLADRLKIIAARSGSQVGEAERLQRGGVGIPAAYGEGNTHARSQAQCHIIPAGRLLG